MKAAKSKEVDILLRDEWLRTIRQLQDQVTLWVSEEPGWSVSEGEARQVQEDLLGVYTAVSLDIETPNGKVILEPIARNYPGREIVELLAWPSSYRVRLIKNSDWGGWRVRTDSGIYLRQEWNRNNFIILANDLMAADA